MLKLHRLGVVLAPDETRPHTVAKFNAGMNLAGDVVHMVTAIPNGGPNLTRLLNPTMRRTRRATPGRRRMAPCSSTRTGRCSRRRSFPLSIKTGG